MNNKSFILIEKRFYITNQVKQEASQLNNENEKKNRFNYILNKIGIILSIKLNAYSEIMIRRIFHHTI